VRYFNAIHEMNMSNKAPAILIGLFLLGGIALFATKLLTSNASAPLIVDVKVPQLSETAKSGERHFNKNCASCHGGNAAGSDQGPPLIHDIYNPGHHADGSFFLAAQRGVRRHHWSFGDMPPQPQMKERQIAEIVAYVRELQKANGIFYKPHQM